MKIKKEVLLGVFLILTVLGLIGGVFGQRCLYATRIDCGDPSVLPNGVPVLGIENNLGYKEPSATTYVLCCDFGSASDRTCQNYPDGKDNKIIGLNSATNHAQIPSYTPSYDTDICYENLYCVGTKDYYGKEWYLDVDNDRLSFSIPSSDLGFYMGDKNDIPLVGDWDGDGIDDWGVFRDDGNGNGHWILDSDKDNLLEPGTDDEQRWLGFSTDIPLVGDWDGDGVGGDGIGYYRPSTRQFYLDDDRNPATTGDVESCIFGLSGDIPVIGKWDNSRSDDRIGIFRPSSGTWYLDGNGDCAVSGGDYQSNGAYGIDGDVPVTGNWDGDVNEVDEIGLFRGGTIFDGWHGTWMLDDGDLTYELLQDTIFLFGYYSDTPLVGDWDGDGYSKVGIFRDANCPPQYPMTTISLESDTNSQIGDIIEYGWQICCNIVMCGDYEIDPGETCDDGANNGLYNSGNPNSPFCTSDCTGYGPYCGDNVWDDPTIVSGSNEECDGSDNSNCNFGETCDAATCLCVTEDYCGDKNIGVGEECDTGPDGKFGTNDDEVGNVICDDIITGSTGELFCYGTPDNPPPIGGTSCTIDSSKCVIQGIEWQREDKTPLSPLESIEVVPGTTLLRMVVKNAVPDTGNFEIYSWDGFNSNTEKSIRTNEQGNQIQGIKEGSDLVGEWVVSSDDLSNAGSNNNFFFRTNILSGASYDIIIQMPDIGFCEQIILCSSYTEQTQCEQDLCNIGAENVQENNPNINCGTSILNPVTNCNDVTTCGCFWDSSAGICNATWDVSAESCTTGTPINIGSCIYSDQGDSGCVNNILTYNWNGSWFWDPSNGWDNWNDGPGENNEEDYIQWLDLKYYYDPQKDSLKCSNGQSTIPCPAQAELPFFGFYHVVASLIIIGIIYAVLIIKRKEFIE